MNDDETIDVTDFSTRPEPELPQEMKVLDAYLPLPEAPTGLAALPRYRPAMIPHSPILAAQMVADPDGEWLLRVDVLALLRGTV